MDTGLGELTPISKNVAHLFDGVPNLMKSRVFTEGEEVKVKGSRFKVDKIKKHTLRLLLLPDE